MGDVWFTWLSQSLSCILEGLYFLPFLHKPWIFHSRYSFFWFSENTINLAVFGRLTWIKANFQNDWNQGKRKRSKWIFAGFNTGDAVKKADIKTQRGITKSWKKINHVRWCFETFCIHRSTLQVNSTRLGFIKPGLGSIKSINRFRTV